MGNLIELRNVTKYYGHYLAVKDVSFSAREGEILGLLGPNGAGKTTIIKILTGYHYPSSGKVYINEFDLYRKPKQAKKLIGYLPERVPLYPDLTVKEYLNFISDARELYGKEKARQISWVVDECGLSGVMDKQMGVLSLGFRQRVGLAQSVIHNPAILILDEPSSGLDPNQTMEIRDLIKRISVKKTILFSTHILKEAEVLCTRILILNSGSLIVQGATNEIGQDVKVDIVFSLTLKADRAVSEEAVRKSVNAMPLKAKIQSLSVFEDIKFELKIQVPNSLDNEEKLFDWAVRSGYKILSMNKDKVSLEDVFMRVTKDADHV
jgi:ABC-2 type transport system ATP-binding protein